MVMAWELWAWELWWNWRSPSLSNAWEFVYERPCMLGSFHSSASLYLICLPKIIMFPFSRAQILFIFLKEINAILGEKLSEEDEEQILAEFESLEAQVLCLLLSYSLLFFILHDRVSLFNRLMGGQIRFLLAKYIIHSFLCKLLWTLNF